MKKNSLIFLIIATSAIIVDQLVKYWVQKNLLEHQSPGFPWPGVFEITLTYNQGIAFGMFKGSGPVTLPFAVIMSGFATWMSFRKPEAPLIDHVAMALLAGGAIGNGIDRYRMGKVTDMFWARIINFPVFNVADVCITFTGVLLVWKFINEGKSTPKEAPTPPASIDPPTESL